MVKTSGQPEGRAPGKAKKTNYIPSQMTYYETHSSASKVLNQSNKGDMKIKELTPSEFQHKHPYQYKVLNLYSYAQTQRKKKPLKKVAAVVAYDKPLYLDKKKQLESFGMTSDWIRTNKKTGKKKEIKAIIVPKIKHKKKNENQLAIFHSTSIAHEDTHASIKTSEKYPRSSEVFRMESEGQLTPEESDSAYYSIPEEQDAYSNEYKYSKYLLKKLPPKASRFKLARKALNRNISHTKQFYTKDD
jgi:hypothetical protein